MSKTTNANSEKAAAPETVDDGKIDYLITDLAPPRIAGRRIEKGQTEIRLSEIEARAEVQAGHLWPKNVKRQPRPKKPAEAAVETPSKED